MNEFSEFKRNLLEVIATDGRAEKTTAVNVVDPWFLRTLKFTITNGN
ncbi:MAG: hypothetical protein KAJ23_09630 [Maribacter sp.]|nr:hypothetical protein [Maribacter sp.]